MNRERHTPASSIFLQAAIAIILVLTSSFNALLIYIGFTLSIFALMTVAGMMRLRKKYPEAKSPYRTFGYPLTPLLFITGNLWIILFSLKSGRSAPCSAWPPSAPGFWCIGIFHGPGIIKAGRKKVRYPLLHGKTGNRR